MGRVVASRLVVRATALQEERWGATTATIRLGDAPVILYVSVILNDAHVLV